MHLFGLMMTSFSSKYYQFVLSYSICSGIGAPLIFAPAMMVVTTYISPHLMLQPDSIIAADDVLPKTMSNYSGFGESRLVLGGVVFPIMVVDLRPKVGFGCTMRMCAFLILGVLTITDLKISSHLQHPVIPFNLSQYLGLLRGINFILMCLASFFLYCKSTPFRGTSEGNYFLNSGSIHPTELLCYFGHL